MPFTVDLIACLLSLLRRLFAKFVSSWMLLILASCVDYFFTAHLVLLSIMVFAKSTVLAKFISSWALLFLVLAKFC